MADMSVNRITTVRGQQKLASMKKASTDVSTLTREQASQLIDAAQLPPNVLLHKEVLIDLIIETHQASTPGVDKLPFEYLLQSAKHPCSLEFSMSKSYEQQVDVTAKQFPPTESEENLEFLRGKLISMSFILAHGYQEQFREHWILDNKGNIIGLKPQHVDRQRKCDAYLKENKQKWRPGITDVGYGGKKKRKTKKHSKKSKKTLRRK